VITPPKVRLLRSQSHQAQLVCLVLLQCSLFLVKKRCQNFGDTKLHCGCQNFGDTKMYRESGTSELQCSCQNFGDTKMYRESGTSELQCSLFLVKKRCQNFDDTKMHRGCQNFGDTKMYRIVLRRESPT